MTFLNFKFITITLILCFFCACQSQEENKFHKIAANYLKEVTANGVKPNHIYVLVPTQSCKNCAKSLFDEIEKIKQNKDVELIFSAHTFEGFTQDISIISNSNIRIDMENRMDKTNFNAGNIILLQTQENGKVNQVKGYEPEEMVNLFALILK